MSIEAMKDKSPLIADLDDAKSHFSGMLTVHRHETFGEGAQKVAYRAMAYLHSIPGDSVWTWFSTERTEVCSKEFRKAPKRGYRGQNRQINRSSKALDSMRQEVCCLVVASFLLKAAQDFVKKRGLHPGKDFPDVTFVRYALAQDTVNEANVFFLEEIIEGPFVKYIHNKLPGPTTSSRLQPETFRIAEYLTAIQHVQYNLTGGLAIVTDFQGMLLITVCLTLIIH